MNSSNYTFKDFYKHSNSIFMDFKFFLHNSPGPKEMKKKEKVQNNTKWNKLGELDVQCTENRKIKQQVSTPRWTCPLVGN